MTAGQALSNKTYIKVHWQWIVLPVLVCVLAAATLIGTMWKTRRVTVPKWKNDPIPLLFLCQGEASRDLDDKEASERAKNLTVRLYGSDSNKNDAKWVIE